MSNAFAVNQGFRSSTLREQMLSHMFIADLIQEVWFVCKQTIEVLRSETDSAGYDSVPEYNGITRHIQLKSSRMSSKTQSHSVSLEPGKKPSGYLVWLKVGVDVTGRKALTNYHFFSADPGKPLSAISTFAITRQPRGNAQHVKEVRLGHPKMPVSRFEKVPNVQELTNKLFELPREEFSFESTN